MLISAIIPSRNRTPDLAVLIQALSGQKLDSSVSLEAVIALDGTPCSAEIRAAGARSRAPVHIIELPYVGISQAKNEAVRAAHGDVLLFLNDDVRPAPDFVAEHAMAQSDLGFKSAVLGWTGWKTPDPAVLMDALIKETRMVFFYNDLEDGKTYSYRHAWNLNLSLPKALFEKAGGFAEDLRPCMYEDLELAWRLAKLDCPVVYHPDASALHEHRYTWESYLHREIMLGLMAPVLASVNQDCFRDIFAMSLDELADKARQGLAADKRDDLKIYNFLAECTKKTAAYSQTPDMLRALYLAHLPIKRRAFRYGLLKGIELADTDWREREKLPANVLLPDAIFK